MRKYLNARTIGMLTVMLFALLAVIEPSFAFDTNSGTEFQTLYDRVVGWVTGIPGIIMAIAFGLIGVMRSFQTGQIFWFFGGILVAVAILLIPTIASGLGFVF